MKKLAVSEMNHKKKLKNLALNLLIESLVFTLIFIPDFLDSALINQMRLPRKIRHN